MAKKVHKYGVLVGGGPAPGINSVISSVTIEAIKRGHTVIGIYDGFKNLMAGQTLIEFFSFSFMLCFFLLVLIFVVSF